MAHSEVPAVAAGSFGVPGSLTRNAYQLPDGLDFEEWEQVGQRLQAVEGAVQWWIGDWLNYGKRHYHDGVVGHQRYWLAIEKFERDYQTLRHYASVANRIPPAERRDSLSFSHHAEVASLGADERAYWLAKADEDRLSKDALRAAIREGNQGRFPDGAPDIKSAAGGTNTGTQYQHANLGPRYAPPSTHQPATKPQRSTGPAPTSQLDIIAGLREPLAELRERALDADPDDVHPSQVESFRQMARELERLEHDAATTREAIERLIPRAAAT